jgi:hypothetical protein
MGNELSCTIFKDEVKGKTPVKYEKIDDLYKEIDFCRKQYYIL